MAKAKKSDNSGEKKKTRGSKDQEVGESKGKGGAAKGGKKKAAKKEPLPSTPKKKEAAKKLPTAPAKQSAAAKLVRKKKG